MSDPILSFLGLEPSSDVRLWRLPMSSSVTTPFGFLYGGAAMAAATAALEAATERPLIWLTIQFADTARSGEVVEVTVETPKAGRSVTQARATGRVGEREIFCALAALGERRPDRLTGRWLEMPDVRPPDDADPSAGPPFPVEGTFLQSFERRLVSGMAFGQGERAADGRVAMWMRVRDQDPTHPAMLGWLADCIPMAFSAVTGEMQFGTSLDNTLRLCARRPSEWILVDVRAVASAGGHGYGDVHLWTTDGHLLGTGSQTTLLRPPRPPG